MILKISNPITFVPKFYKIPRKRRKVKPVQGSNPLPTDC